MVNEAAAGAPRLNHSQCYRFTFTGRHQRIVFE